MGKDLERIKKAFLTKSHKSSPSKEFNPSPTKGLLASIIGIILLGIFLNLYFQKEKSSQKQSKPLATVSYPEEIDSIVIINNKGILKPLEKILPLALENLSLKTLIINLKNPLDLYQKIIKIYFKNPLKKVKLVLKDSSYYSNSHNPANIGTNKENILEINFANLALQDLTLNPYRITQLRLEINGPLLKQKIKDIKIVQKGG